MARSRRGANAVEFALVLPVLLTFTFGIIDLGWASLLRHGASSAAGKVEQPRSAGPADDRGVPAGRPPEDRRARRHSTARARRVPRRSRGDRGHGRTADGGSAMRWSKRGSQSIELALAMPFLLVA